MHVRAVLFDLYETLVTEYDSDWREPWERAHAERLGMDVEAFRDAWSALRDRRVRGDIPDFASAVREICTPDGIEPLDEVLTELTRDYLALKAKPFASLDPGLLAALRALRSRGVRLAVVTNASTEEVAALPRSALGTLVDVVVTSYETRVLKPDREIYLHACRRLGVASDAAAFVGDGGSDELRGARDAGLTPYWATWFLDRWPSWREIPDGAARFPRLRDPAQLLEVLPLAQR